MENLEDTFTVSVIGNGLGVTAGAIQDLIRDAHLKRIHLLRQVLLWRR